MLEKDILKIDKKYTHVLLKAIDAAKNSEFVSVLKYDLDHFNISLREETDLRSYVIRFYSEEVTQDNWMDVGSGGLEIYDIIVEINIDTEEINRIYGSR